jgi:hypothetical protein
MTNIRGFYKKKRLLEGYIVGDENEKKKLRWENRK